MTPDQLLILGLFLVLYQLGRVVAEQHAAIRKGDRY
jgi:hypothetical protein